LAPDAAATMSTGVSGRRGRVAPRGLRASVQAVIYGTGSVIAFVLAWHIASRFYPPALLPSPERTLSTLVASLRSGVMETHALASLRRVLLGFAIGAVTGALLGLIAGVVRLARMALDPYVNFFRFVPAIALLTPFVVWFGIGEASKVLLIVFATLFIVLLNTVAGVDDMPVDRLRAARMLGASRWQEFRLIVLPSTLPYVLTGMRIAMGVSFASIIVAEMVSADAGLGYLLSYSMVISATDLQFVTILCLGVLGFATDKAFQLLARAAFGRYR